MFSFRVYTNALAQLAAKASTALISVFLIRILTNYLSIEGYGLYSELYNYLSLFAVVADLGLYTVTIRELSKHADDSVYCDQLRAAILSIRLGMGTIIIALSIIVACFIPVFETPVALIWVAIVAFFTLFGLIESSLRAWLQARMATEFSFVSTTLGKVTNFSLVLAIAFWWLPIAAAPEGTQWLLPILLAALAGNVVMTGVLAWYARRHFSVGLSRDIVLMKALFIKTLPFGLALFLNAIFFKVDILLLTLLLPEQSAHIAVALYSVPMKIIEVAMMLAALFLNSLLPTLTGAFATMPHTIRPLLMRAVLLLGGAGLFWATLLTLFGREILSLVVNSDYINAAIYSVNSLDAMLIVAWILPLYFLSSVATFSLIALDAQGQLLRVNAFIAFLNVVWNILVIPSMSFIGSAWVTLASQVLLLVGSWWLVAVQFKNRRMKSV